MRTPIYVRRGNKVDLPVLSAGEPGFATDTKELFVGTASGNEQIHAPYDKTSAFRATSSALQTLTNSAANKILFQSKDFDHLSEFDNVTNYRFTASKSGIYVVTGFVNVSGYAAGSVMELNIYKNGAISRRTSGTPGGTAASLYGTFQLKLVAGDYLEIYVYNGSASGTVQKDNTASLTFFEVTRIA